MERVIQEDWSETANFNVRFAANTERNRTSPHIKLISLKRMED
jgi:hypothetical protein